MARTTLERMERAPPTRDFLKPRAHACTLAAEELNLLIAFSLVLVGAELGSLLFQWLRLPRILGMIAAGTLLGPHVNPLANDLGLLPERISDLALLGGVFLMFSIGLSFNVRNFRRVGAPAVLIALAAGVVSLAGGFAVARLLGLTVPSALVVGLILTPTSTVVSVRLAHDLNLLATRGIDLTIASIVLDDVTSLVLATIVLGFIGTDPQTGIGSAILGLLVVILLALLIILFAMTAVPRALGAVARLSGENPTLLAVSAGFFVAFLFTLLELPPILGAFWAGSIIASSRFGERINDFVRPVSEVFSAVFFSAMGMLLDPAVLPGMGLLVLAIVGVGLVGKAGTGYFALRAFHIPPLPAAACAAILVPRGEVSLVIAQFAGGPDQDTLQILATAVVFGTTLLAPLLVVLLRTVLARAARPAPDPAPPSE